jgi:hypothetical protein
MIESGFGMVKAVDSQEAVLPEDAGDRTLFIMETLKRWKKEYTPDGAVIGLPLEKFSHQLIEMPRMRRPDLRMALMFDLEKYLPLPVDEYLFDFIMMPGERGNLNVMVLSIKRDVFNSFSRYFEEAGIAILSVRCGAIQAICSLTDAAGEKNVEGLFVNITEYAYEIAGIKNSMPLYLKSFPKNADLQTELERLALLYPGTVYFLGDSGPGVSEKFRDRKFHFSVAHGLASSYKKKSRVNMDFIPPEMLKAGTDYYPYLIGCLAASALVLFLLTGLLTYYRELTTLKSVETRRLSIKGKASGVLEARKKLDLLQNDRKVLSDFLGRSNVAIKAMSDLSTLLPKDAWLINFSVDDKGKIELEGFSGNTSELVVALEKSKVFRNVSFSAPVIAKEGEERFALKMEVEGP